MTRKPTSPCRNRTQPAGLFVGARPQHMAACRRRARAGQQRRILQAAACGCWRLRSAVAVRRGWGRRRAAVMLGRHRHGARMPPAVRCQQRRHIASSLGMAQRYSCSSMLRTANAHRLSQPHSRTALRSAKWYRKTALCHAVSNWQCGALFSSGCPGDACISRTAQSSSAVRPCACGC